MKKCRKNILIMTVLAVVMLAAIQVSAFAAVDVLFVPATATVQRNGFITAYVKASANVAAQITAIDANFTYDKNKLINPVLQSSITGWPQSVEQISTSNGYVTYQKNNVGQSAYHFDVGAGEVKQIYSVTYKAASGAALGNTELTYVTQGFLNVIEGVSNITGTSNVGQITILPDTTSPITRASRSSGIYNAVFTVTLSVDPSDQSGDLNRIHYTTDGTTPDLSSPYYTAPISIPANTTTILKFFGVDNTGNTENVQLRTYTVDTIAPAISSLIVSPNFAGLGRVVTISFEVSEALQGGAPSSVRIGSISATAYDVSYPTYGYFYTALGTEAEGTHNVTIVINDMAGNQTTDTSQFVAFDFTPPTYSGAAVSAVSGTEFYVRFTASEALDTTRTQITTSGNAWVYERRDGKDYIYKYTPLGTETSRLIEVRGYDLAGNNSRNTTGWNILKVQGTDLFGNPGSGTVTININYEP
jgi:hypothetical protein